MELEAAVTTSESVLPPGGAGEGLGAPEAAGKEGGGEDRSAEAVVEMETTPARPVSDKERPPSSTPTPTSSLPSPLLPLPDFMNALNMQFSRKQAATVEGEGPVGVAKSPLETEKMSLGPGSKEVLIEKFKKGM